MNCETATSLLPWLINASLEPGDLEALGDHLASCERCRLELARTREVGNLFDGHPAAEDLADHTARKLPPARAELVADHVTSCAECRRELALLIESRREFEGAFGPLSSAVVRWPRRAPALRWQWIAAAASLAAVVASWGWLSTRTALQRETSPVANVAVLEVLPQELIQRGGPTNELVLGERTESVTLVLVSAPERDLPEVEVEIRDRQGRRLWRATGVVKSSQGVYTLGLPAEMIPPDELRVVVLAREGGRWIEAESYEIRVRR